MVWMICKNELRLHCLDLRLPLTLVAAVLFCVVTMMISCRHFREKMQEYDAVRTHHQVSPMYLYGDLPPNLLGVFCTGAFLKAPASVQKPKMPYYGIETNVLEHPTDRILFSQTQYPDLGFVLAAVVGLGALVFAYDSVCGEKEKGTLKLAFTNPLRRHELLLGKFLAGVLGLSVVVIVVWLIAILMVVKESPTPLRGNDVGLLALGCLVSLLYVSVLLAMALLISSLVSVSRTALVCCVSLWLISCLLVPPLGPVAAKVWRKTPVYQQFVLAKHTLLKEETREPIEACKKIRVEKPDQAVAVLVRTINEVGTKWSKRNEELIADYRQQITRQEDLSCRICAVSPASAFQFALSELCGTSIHAYRDFVRQTEDWARAYAASLWGKYGKDPATAFQIFSLQADQANIRPFPARLRIRHCLEYVVYMSVLVVVTLAVAFVRFVRYDLR